MRTIEKVIYSVKHVGSGRSDIVTLEELEAWQAQRDTADARIAELGKQRRRDGLSGQATLDEANNRIAELERQLEHADLIITKYGINGESPWTPVSEGLPEVSIACLLQMQNGEYIPAKRVSSTKVHPDGDLEDLNNGDVINPAQVLRWMPIPEHKPE